MTLTLTLVTPIWRWRPATWAIALMAGALLAACGAGKEKASQTAANVNRTAITVHQINFVLQQQHGLAPEQADAAGRDVLEWLIDQELAVQRAGDLKLDRDPRVLQQLEAARRAVLARAYAESVGEAVVRPAPEEVKRYYDANPALFGQRRMYTLHEISIEATQEEITALRARVATLSNIGEFTDYLRAAKLRFIGAPALRAAEQLPQASLGALAAMKDGQALMNTTPDGAQVVILESSRPAPISEVQARSAIEQYLINERKRDLVEKDRKALRDAAAIKYVGKFAEGRATTGNATGTAAVSAPPNPAVIQNGVAIK